MALVTLVPLDPTVATDVTDIPTGSASGFAAGVNTRKSTLRDRDKLIQARLEKLIALIGDGWVSGGTTTAGAGLSVSVAALEAICGQYLQLDAATTVGGLAASVSGAGTNRIWLRQDGTFTVNQSGTAPSSGDGRGDSLLWATADTNATTVTSVSNVRRSFDQERSFVAIVSSDPTNLVDGDLWFNSTDNKLKVRVSGVTKATAALT